MGRLLLFTRGLWVLLRSRGAKRVHTVTLAAIGASLCALLVPIVHRQQLRLVWNASASVPLGLYRITPGASVRVGDMVAVRPSPDLARFMAARHYVEAGVVLLKPIAAVSGAIVCRRDQVVTIDGVPAARALARDRFGRSLPVWSGCHRLQPNEAFLLATRSSASFDSRYFGVVRTSQMLGRAKPIWTWS